LFLLWAPKSESFVLPGMDFVLRGWLLLHSISFFIALWAQHCYFVFLEMSNRFNNVSEKKMMPKIWRIYMRKITYLLLWSNWTYRIVIHCINFSDIIENDVSCQFDLNPLLWCRDPNVTLDVQLQAIQTQFLKIYRMLTCYCLDDTRW